MKKTLSFFVAILLVFTLAVPAAAGDVIWSKDTTLTNFINRYDNAMVKAGVTLTMKQFQPDPQGLEIAKSLTVEPDGKITGGGCIIFSRGATCAGLDLYYLVGGQEKLLTASLAELCALFPQADYQPTFWYESNTEHYVLHGNSFDSDPFDAPPPPGGEDNSGSTTPGDDRTERFAQQLKALGLFLGSDRGFELDRAPTRVEEVVMLIRLLGKEQEALGSSWTHPFSDVPTWADRYVGYAYENNLAGGVGGGKFGTAVPATAQMFVTFVLRAMGYTDDTRGGTDFTYAKATDFAMERGLIAGEGDVAGFDRGVCVRIMEAALRNALKDGGRLSDKLIEQGVFTREAYENAFS